MAQMIAEPVTPMRPKQKTLVGTVVSDKMDKTVVVTVASSKRDRLYGKTLRRTTRYKAHDPNNVCKLGDTVRLVEIRPMSKEKRWRVVDILQHRQVAEIQPAVIGRELEETVGRGIDPTDFTLEPTSESETATSDPVDAAPLEVEAQP